MCSGSHHLLGVAALARRLASLQGILPCRFSCLAQVGANNLVRIGHFVGVSRLEHLLDSSLPVGGIPVEVPGNLRMGLVEWQSHVQAALLTQD